MKVQNYLKFFIIFCVLQLIAFSEIYASEAQDIYKSGEVIIKFIDGTLNKSMLETKQKQFNIETNLIAKPELRNQIKSLGGSRLKKVFTKVKSSVEYTISRTGKQVKRPDFYNWLIIEIPEGAPVKELCEKFAKLDDIICRTKLQNSF